jgi:medium-chain acyl-[acyl-carrier-protein] hydrolase
MVVDMNSRRPHRPDLVKEALRYVRPEMALGKQAEKITFNENGKDIGSHVVKFSDMDLNGHVNNAKYVEWIFDAIAPEKSQQPHKQFHINYLSEATLGEEILFSEHTEHGMIKVKAHRSSDHRIIFVAEIS